jgi:hypothetical protein
MSPRPEIAAARAITHTREHGAPLELLIALIDKVTFAEPNSTPDLSK